MGLTSSHDEMAMEQRPHHHAHGMSFSSPPTTSYTSSSPYESDAHSIHSGASTPSSTTTTPTSRSQSFIAPPPPPPPPPFRERKRTLGFLSQSEGSHSDEIQSLMSRRRMREKEKDGEIKETKKVVLGKDEETDSKKVNQYSIMKTIGKGAFGKVKLCIDSHNRPYAIKILNKKKFAKEVALLNGGDMQGIYREIAILKRLRHPNVVKLYEVIDDPSHDKMFLVFEYVENGSIVKLDPDTWQSNKTFAEGLARKYMTDIVRGVDYLHSQKVVHRDIKPDNLLLNRDDVVKVSDLGVSQLVTTYNDMLQNYSGTPAFLSPEICSSTGNAFSGRQADVWAIGITLYIFIFGVCPFVGDSLHEIQERILNQTPTFPKDTPTSSELKDLILKLLEKDPKKRITLKEVLDHPWMKIIDPSTPRINQIRHRDVNMETRSAITDEEVSNAIIVIDNTIPMEDSVIDDVKITQVVDDEIRPEDLSEEIVRSIGSFTITPVGSTTDVKTMNNNNTSHASLTNSSKSDHSLSPMNSAIGKRGSGMMTVQFKSKTGSGKIIINTEDLLDDDE